MRKLIFALVFGALIVPDYAFTLGMGEIEVNSALNQQLNARIELLSSVPEDAETLIIKLASREEFARAGLDRPFSLNSLKFRSFVENGQVFINVTTPKPVREPFLNFLVEVDWPKGHLLREYTILLDPPVFMGQQDTGSTRPAVSSRPAASQAATAAPVPAQSAAQAGRPAVSGFRPAPVAAPTPSRPAEAVPATSQSQYIAPAPVQQRTSYTSPSYSSPSGGYRVQAGDTAWSLADSMRPDQSVSVQQMLLAMLRINPEVFINENVNGLKKGYILRIPDRAEITSISQEEAKAIVREQNALWREYQQTLSVDQPASAIERDGETETGYGSGIKSSSDSRLSIVSAGSGAAASGEMKDPTEMTAEELREQLALAREQLETERVTKEGLQGDVGTLEQKIEQMQGLLQIQDDSMAEIQSVRAGAEEEAVAEEDATETAEISGEEAALDALDQLTGEADATAPEVAADEQATVEGEEVFVDEQAAMEQLAEQEEIEVDVAEPAQVDIMPREEPGLVASLLGNPLVAAGAALLVLVLLAVGYILVKRRRDSAGADAEATLAADLEQGFDSDLEEIADSVEDDMLDDFVADAEVEAPMAEAEAAVEAEGEEAFDSESTMILPSAQDTVVTQAVTEAEPEEEEEERDDVIAEADVYLAYGIYQQAEELLQNALNDNPDKDVYRVKLAETYFAAKNSDSLVKLGTEMKEKLGGEETKAWQKVVTLGKELCPEADIFQQADTVADLDIDDLMPKSPEPMDFDLGDTSTAEGDAPDLDLDFDSPMEEESAAPEIPVDETAVIPTPGDDAGELEFDIGETEAVEEPAAEPELAAEEEFSLDIEASELDIEEAPADEISLEEDSVEIDSSELDFDMGLDEDLAESSEDEISADADISIDAADLDFSMDADESLTEEVAAAPTEEPAPVEAPAAQADDLDLSDLGDVDEINTKLDLARAYLDMGDHEGARDILDEVVAEGNAQQKQEAEELISQLG